MYSMVLMAALTAGSDVPDWWGRRGWGCCGCYGGWGGYGWGGYGMGGYGWGRGWGGWGGWGGYGWGGWGGWGYAYAPMAPVFAGPMIVSNTLPAGGLTTRSFYYDPTSPLFVAGGNRATIVAHLPADATLIVNGKPTRSTTGTRRFFSPPLDPKKNYSYTFKAEMKRNGQTVTLEKRVPVRAGKSEVVYLQIPQTEHATHSDNPPDQPAEKRDLPKKLRMIDRPR